jgi:hypothetical protein
MATETKARITKQTARDLMPIVDEAIKQALAAKGFEAFRFDADVCPEEGWLRLKIKVRPVGRT